jgi:hypothetical protein
MSSRACPSGRSIPDFEAMRIEERELEAGG